MRLLALAVAAVIALGACGRAPDPPNRPKLVILGFDGLDPELVKQFMDAGHLPTFKRVMQEGGFAPLETTVSPESPTAWASFATGVNPGKHNIYDFLVRNVQTYVPDLGMVRREPPAFWFDWIPVRRPKVHSIRGGTSFWMTAGQAGVRSSILTVPITFPPEDVPHGELLSGLPLPDLRGTMGTFSYFATDVSRLEEGNTEFGGIIAKLSFQGNTARTNLVGPPNPLIRPKIKAIYDKGGKLSDADRVTVGELAAEEDLKLPMTVTWTPGSHTAAVTVGGQTTTLKTGEWSKWIDLDFRLNVFVKLRGMAQMYLLAADAELRLYISPINFHPASPPVPISAPAGLAADLYERLGAFRTLGWAEANWPLEENRIDEALFMDDLYRAFDDRAQVILDRLTRRNWDLLVGVIEAPDRVQHMMYRLIDTSHPMHDAALAAKFADAIRSVYRRADQFVAAVLEQLEPGTTLMIVSDHGFHSWRKAVNLNTWLVQNGYMVIQGQTATREKTLDDLFGGGEYFEGVDWSRTRAYAMGLGQIYFNLRGREGQGIVSPGAEYLALADEIASKLKADLLDPETKQRIVRAVYKRDDVYRGEFIGQASDLQVGFEEGYRVSWQTCLGASPPGLVYPNMKKWSGDHGGFDYQTTAGVLLSNKPLGTTAPRIIDIAPTVLKFFGIAVPDTIDGIPLFKN
jgi:predicted AlkP superfamily phosphohydrolase/phosphomutase